MEEAQDLFISHASADKEQYILPLSKALTTYGVSFWLDSNEIGWGDNIPMKINEGLRNTRYALLCLSNNYLERPWPETEMSAVLAIQNNDGGKRVLPLILNSKETIFQKYPILSSLAYRDFSSGADRLAQELSTLVGAHKMSHPLIKIIVESAHTGQLCNLIVSPRVSVRWLANKAQAGLNVKEKLEAGEFVFFHIRWVLVDVQARTIWKSLPRHEKRNIYAVIKTEEGIKYSYDDTDRLEKLGIYDGVVFRLFPIEDERYDFSEEELFIG